MCRFAKVSHLEVFSASMSSMLCYLYSCHSGFLQVLHSPEISFVLLLCHWESPKDMNARLAPARVVHCSLSN